MMNVIDYLNEYKDISFKDAPFNEADALLFALLSYFPFDRIKKGTIKPKHALKFLETYEPEKRTKRKLLDIVVLRTVCESSRYKGIFFTDFVKRRSNESIEQFQAVTIIIKDKIIISYCGTDGTLLGWREDFNMSFLDIIPAEISAIRYADKIRKAHPFRKMIMVGHSKGGRLASRAGKELYKKNKLEGIYNFDGPNFLDDFYDDKYAGVQSLTHLYTPSDSIIGRLINNKEDKMIVDSSEKLFLQHDAYNWLIEDNHFIYLDHYSKQSDEITRIIDHLFKGTSLETKQILINTVFDVLENSPNAGLSAKTFIAYVSNVWNRYPKERRGELLKIAIKNIFDIIHLINLLSPSLKEVFNHNNK